jgi:hypothetical protein
LLLPEAGSARRRIPALLDVFHGPPPYPCESCLFDPGASPRGCFFREAVLEPQPYCRMGARQCSLGRFASSWCSRHWCGAHLWARPSLAFLRNARASSPFRPDLRRLPTSAVALLTLASADHRGVLGLLSSSCRSRGAGKCRP